MPLGGSSPYLKHMVGLKSKSPQGGGCPVVKHTSLGADRLISSNAAKVILSSSPRELNS